MWLIAPNAFKGSLSASEAATVIQQALLQAGVEMPIRLQPIADGGDGTCALLAESLKLEQRQVTVLDAYGRSLLAPFYLERSAQRAFLDVSAAVGLGDREGAALAPTLASSFGVGMQIAAAVQEGARELVLALGGTATIDAAMGILQGLGFVLLNRSGHALHPYHPDRFHTLAYIQRPIRLPSVRFTLLADVRHQLFGKEGGIVTFGPQKGLKMEALPEVEEGLANWIHLLYKKGGKPFLDQEGFGAAGGLAAGLAAFFPVEIHPGAAYFFQQVQMARWLRQSHVVITGEGRYDAQSAFGKGPHALLCLARELNPKAKRVLISSGTYGRQAPAEHFISLPPLQQVGDGAKREAAENLFRACYQAFRGD
ncbi:MAG: glycerate kinase family protein [Nitritalea sp.]